MRLTSILITMLVMTFFFFNSMQVADDDQDGVRHCKSCGLVIMERHLLNIAQLNLYWHLSCLRCSACHQSLVADDKCYIDDGLIYCRQHYFNAIADDRFSNFRILTICVSSGGVFSCTSTSFVIISAAAPFILTGLAGGWKSNLRTATNCQLK